MQLFWKLDKTLTCLVLKIRFCVPLFVVWHDGAWVKRKTAVWAFCISRQHPNIPTNNVIYSKPRGIYTRWKKTKNKELITGFNQKGCTEENDTQTHTALTKGKTPGFISLKRKAWDLSSSIGNVLTCWRFILSLFFSFLLDTAFHGTSAKTLPSQPAARRTTLKTMQSRSKILFGPSLVTTALVGKTKTFHLWDRASSTVTGKIQHSLTTGK